MNIKFQKEDIVIIAIVIIVVLLYIAVLVHFIATMGCKSIIIKEQNNTEAQQENGWDEMTGWKCLGDDEIVEYVINKKEKEQSTATIIIKDKKIGERKKSFDIYLPIANHYHPLEIHKCAIYANRSFGFNFDKKRVEKDYSFEFWKYDFSGQEEKVLFLSGPISGHEFNSDFRVDPLERYVVLIKGYYGKDYYSLIIKDLETKEDVFVLSHSKLLKQYPEMKGMFDFREWTKDGKYFYGALSEGAIEKGFFRVNTENWEYETFEVPKFIGGGDQLNVETGWVTYHTDMVWIGVHQLTEELKQERIEQGIGTKFYLYNLFTKKKIFVYETDEPLFFTKPEWISETEVEYELPNGEKRVYQVK